MNRFFNAALTKASQMVGKPGRIILLLTKLGTKMKSVQWHALAKDSKDKLLVLSRMAHAFSTGRYRAISPKSVVIIIAGLLYFINPLDLIPDFILVIGLTDDVGVLLWIYNSLQKEIDKFLAWEQGIIPRKL